SGLTSVEIPNSVISIGSSAFYGCSGLTSVEIPNSVISIGSSAFYGCSGLTSVEIGNSVTSIGAYAFRNCSGLISIELPESLTKIENGVFMGCTNLVSANIPKSLTYFGGEVFYGCDVLTTLNYNAVELELWVIGMRNSLPSNIEIINIGDEVTYIPPFFSDCKKLTSIIIPNSVTIIGREAFKDCKNLTSVEIGNSVLDIQYSAFEGCSGLSELTIPKCVTSIGANAFKGCSSLVEMRLPEGVTAIPEGAFADCTSLQKVIYSQNVDYLGDYAFNNCSALRSVKIPATLTEISGTVFTNCSSLTEINIPNSVTTIDELAFQGCDALMNVSFGTGIYSIGNYAFNDCINLENIYCLSKNPPYADQYTFPIPAYTNAFLHVREDALSKFNQLNPWFRFEKINTIDSGISLSHYDITMAGNQVFQLGVYGAEEKVVWSSTNPEIAYANDCGLIVAMGPTGITTITATSGDLSVSCRVVVNSPRQIKALDDGQSTIEPKQVIIESIGGNPLMVNARLIPVGSCTVLEWSTSDELIATVENGLVNIVEEGEVEFLTETQNGLDDWFEADTEDIMNQQGTSNIDDFEFETTLGVSFDIYTLQGVCLKREATQSDIEALAPGIYIIGGKKVMVK
ncbi:MAG: leucine-rich repeat protein, partial [Muribaculaceae bacterium]|nr:leucine-rich repeat protein [Muribaculaceae bacterium]